jgi:hypothetical protein
MDAIAEKKEEIYKSLKPNPLEPDMLVAGRTFRVDNGDYVVTFGIDERRATQSVFRVMHIERAGPPVKS